MQCKDVEELIYDNNSLSGELQEHVNACTRCRKTWEELRLVRAGFKAMAQDPVPEAMLGFSARLVRRLETALDANRSAAEFMESVGRRFVLAGLLLTMSILLVLAMPSSGPLRGPGRDEPYLTQPEPSLPTEATVLGDEYSEPRYANPANPINGGEQK